MKTYACISLRKGGMVLTVCTCVKCGPLSENPALCAFCENRDNTGNRYIDVQLCGSEKWKRSVAWFPSYEVKCITDRMQLFEKTQCFYVK